MKHYNNKLFKIWESISNLLIWLKSKKKMIQTTGGNECSVKIHNTNIIILMLRNSTIVVLIVTLTSTEYSFTYLLFFFEKKWRIIIFKNQLWAKLKLITSKIFISIGISDLFFHKIANDSAWIKLWDILSYYNEILYKPLYQCSK